MTDFTEGYNNEYTYTIENLPIGKYRIEEKGFVPADGCEAKAKFFYWDGFGNGSSTYNQSTFYLKANHLIDMWVLNTSVQYETVKFQKSVYEIGKLKKGASTWSSLPEKYLFAIDDEDTEKI